MRVSFSIQWSLLFMGLNFVYIDLCNSAGAIVMLHIFPENHTLLIAWIYVGWNQNYCPTIEALHKYTHAYIFHVLSYARTYHILVGDYSEIYFDECVANAMDDFTINTIYWLYVVVDGSIAKCMRKSVLKLNNRTLQTFYIFDPIYVIVYISLKVLSRSIYV